MIAVINGRRPEIVEDGYNARLIASAPDILETLKLCAMHLDELVNVDGLDKYEKALYLCNLAIAKAE